jgi:hypothetical protein
MPSLACLRLPLWLPCAALLLEAGWGRALQLQLLLLLQLQLQAALPALMLCWLSCSRSPPSLCTPRALARMQWWRMGTLG